MTVGRDGVRLQYYWQLDPARDLRLGSDAEYAEAFRDLFTDAVRRRLRNADPVGSALSGGLDSSAVACTARNLIAEKTDNLLPTFSAVFETVPECDERSYIQAVLAQGGFHPHYIEADRLSPLAELDRIYQHQDEPFHAPNLYIHWAMYECARQRNVRVFLDGLDGDTTVSHGVPYLAELARRGRLLALVREARALANSYATSPYKLLWRYGMKPLIPDPLRQVWRGLRGRDRVAEKINPTIHPQFSQRIGLPERVRTLLADRDRPARSAREDHFRRLTSGVIPFVLEVADRAAAAFSLESRYPFFDRRLAEFCLALPPEQRISQGWTRLVMRRALSGVFPEEVRERRGKSNLGANFDRGLRTQAHLLLEEAIEGEPNVLEAYVDLKALRELLRRYMDGQTDDPEMAIWKAVTLGLWLSRVRA
jgi:asparagine synthase (glutamine-hydrolysing)